MIIAIIFSLNVRNYLAINVGLDMYPSPNSIIQIQCKRYSI